MVKFTAQGLDTKDVRGDATASIAVKNLENGLKLLIPDSLAN
jgi:hypothetical protein